MIRTAKLVVDSVGAQVFVIDQYVLCPLSWLATLFVL
jgi:hypothetical protein